MVEVGRSCQVVELLVDTGQVVGVITDEQRSRQCHAVPRNSSTVSTLLLPHSISLAWTPSPNFPNKKSIFQTAPALILVRTAAAKT